MSDYDRVHMRICAYANLVLSDTSLTCVLLSFLLIEDEVQKSDDLIKGADAGIVMNLFVDNASSKAIEEGWYRV